MPLLDDAIECIERLKKADSARTGVEEAQALDELHRDLLANAMRISEVANQAKILRAEGIALSKLPQLTTTVQIVANIATRFQEKPVSTSLNHGKRWKDLLEALSVAHKNCREAQLIDWQTFYRGGLFSGLSPSQIRSTMPKTPANDKAITVYAELYNKFAVYKSAIPPSRELIQEVKKYSKELESIKFDRDVPDEVRVFFEATSLASGANIELLTDAVIKYLQDHKLLGNYAIRARVD